MSAPLSRGDIVLVPFPFTNLSGRKVRPALVLNAIGEDVLVAFLSSVVSATASGPTDWVLRPSHPDFFKTGLKVASTFRLAKLVCLHQSLILRKLGHITPAIQREVDVRLARAVGLA